MKKTKIRKSVFETNSSSCHSLVRKNKHLSESELPIDKYGFIHINFGSFEDYGNYDSQSEKLSYILTHIYYEYGHYRDKGEFINDTYEFSLLRDAIMDYTGCLGLVIDNDVDDAELNHQLIGDLEQIVDIYKDQDIIDFIFDNDVILEIWRD